MQSNCKEYEDANRLVKDEREAVAVHFHNLKDEMNKFRDSERARLTQLTLQSNKAIKELQRKKEKGEVWKALNGHPILDLRLRRSRSHRITPVSWLVG